MAMVEWCLLRRMSRYLRLVEMTLLKPHYLARTLNLHLNSETSLLDDLIDVGCHCVALLLPHRYLK